jgi:integrase
MDPGNKPQQGTPQRLTERFAAAVSFAEPMIVWDSECRGFGLRVMPSGVKSFVLDYRVGGRQRRMTIGRFGDWTVEGARKHARELKVQVDKGIDPFHETEGRTVREAWLEYERTKLPKLAPRTQVEYRRYAGVFLERLGNYRLGAVTFRDVEALHNSYAAPYAGNRCIEVVRLLFNAAIKWRWADHNPARGVDYNPENAREDQYLSAGEAKKLLVALEESRDADVADMLVFLLATGCRPSEARMAVWSQFDLEAGIWTKPAATTKQRRTHRVPLNAIALRVLLNRPKRERSELVFSYPDGRPIRRGEKVWRSACRRAGVPQIMVYGARHSFASLAAAAGISLQVVGALMGHTQIKTTHRYSHLFDEVLRQGARAVGEAMKQ